MKTISFIGRSGSGKTTLIEKILPLLKEKGLTIGSIKHTHHDLNFDKEGKDSYKHRKAGAAQTLLVSSNEAVLFSQTHSLDKMLDKWFQDMDIVIIEGYKNYDGHKIEVIREKNNKKPIFIRDKIKVDVIVADYNIDFKKAIHPPKKIFNFNDIDLIIKYILDIVR